MAREAALTEVMVAINAAGGDSGAVFALILEKAHQFCGARLGALVAFDGAMFHRLAWHGYPASLSDSLARPYPHRERHAPLLRGERFVQSLIVLSEMDPVLDPVSFELAKALNLHAQLMVPLRKDGVLIGMITAGRTEPIAFSESDIALLESFASQAAIAMDNARLVGELRERTQELAQRNAAYGERIGQQAATIDVLQAMAASPEDARPVLQLILDRARAFCDSTVASLALVSDGMLVDPVHSGFDTNTGQSFEALFPRPVGNDTLLGRAVLSGEISQLPDNAADPSYSPLILSVALRAGARSHASLPLRRGGAVIGAMMIARPRPGAYTDSQMELLRTFAEQAVIALSSAETFQALHDRTADLSRSLEQRTAVAEVLAVINANPGDMTPVFDTILEKAHRLCGGIGGHLVLYDGGGFRRVAYRGMSGATSALLTREQPIAGSPRDQLLRGERFVHIPDLDAPDVPRFQGLEALRDRDVARQSGWRSATIRMTFGHRDEFIICCWFGGGKRYVWP